MRLIELAYGFPPYHALLQIELGEHPPLPRTPDRSAGVWIVHPGAGLVSRVRGRGLVERLPGLVEGRFRVKAGSRVEERQGSGQEVGHFVFAARHRSDVVAALNQARRLLKIELD